MPSSTLAATVPVWETWRDLAFTFSLPQASMLQQLKWSFSALGAVTSLVYPGLIFHFIVITPTGIKTPKGLKL